METILVVLHVVFAVAIVGLVLVQRSEGGGLGIGGGGGGGMGGLMSARGTADLLTRATAVVATLFFLSSLSLSILVSRRTDPVSIVETVPVEGAPEALSDGPAVPAAPAEPRVPTAE